MLVVVLFWTALYKGISSRQAPTAPQSPPIMSQQTAAPSPLVEKTEPIQEAPTTQPVLTSAVASAPIGEAPPPFEEPQATFGSTPVSSTAIPTDITAVTNISNPVENAGPVLVIAKPKRARRATKRLPTNGTPRRKRSAQTMPELTAPESIAPSGQQNQDSQ